MSELYFITLEEKIERLTARLAAHEAAWDMLKPTIAKFQHVTSTKVWIGDVFDAINLLRPGAED